MNPRQDLVNLFAQCVVTSEPCMRCHKDVRLSERAYIYLYSAYRSGACVVFLCDECMQEHNRTHGSAPKVTPKVLPLP